MGWFPEARGAVSKPLGCWQSRERSSMQKTFLKFIVFELVERVARFRLLLNECADALHESAPQLHKSLLQEADQLEAQLLNQKSALNTLFTEAAASKKGDTGFETLIESLHLRLQELSQVLCHLQPLSLVPETHLFLKEALPGELTQAAGEQSVFLAPEGKALSLPSLSQVFVDSLPVLQKNNPLAWVRLSQSFSRFLAESTSSLESLKLELTKGDKKKALTGVPETLAESLIQHAINLRLLGPAYYFQAVAEAFFAKDEAFLQVIEPALFFGLNHQNFTHKSLVILHEACERSKPKNADAYLPLSEELLPNLFRVVEKVIPAKFAFQEKNMQRAVQLQERLSQGILLSSTPLFPVEEVHDTLHQSRGQADFNIYSPLSMLTEYPHSAKEIVNAGWLHKIERGPVWLYSILNEERQEGFEQVMSLLDYQDHLLRKSIETSEIHRVLMSAQ